MSGLRWVLGAGEESQRLLPCLKPEATEVRARGLALAWTGAAVGVEALEVQELWGRAALRTRGCQPCSREGRTQDEATYQLRQHLLQLVHVHESQVLCLGLPDAADGCFCHHVGGQ